MVADDSPPGSARISRLSVTPIKGFALHHPEEVRLEASGAAGDRDFVVVDERDRIFSITKTGAWLGLRASFDAGTGRLGVRDAAGRAWEDDLVLGERVSVDVFGFRRTPGRVVEGPWSSLLSELADRPVRLVRTDAPGDGSDVHPVTMLGDATVAHVAAQAGLDGLDPRRFRMLLGIAGTPAHAEDGWRGRRLAIGGAVLEVGGPVPRCAGITRHPERGDRDVPVVRHIRAYRGLLETELGRGVPLGVYARVVRPGVVRVGDALVPEALPADAPATRGSGARAGGVVHHGPHW